MLESATLELARMLGQPAQKLPAALLPHRDASPAAQAARYYDERSDEPWEGGRSARGHELDHDQEIERGAARERR